MNIFGSLSKPLMGFMALLLAALVAGCGGGGDGGKFPGAFGPSTAAGAGTGVGGLGRGPAPIDLLSVRTNNFVVLTNTGITNTGSHLTAITGNIGSSPITAAAMNTVFCSEITGLIYGVDAGYVGSGSGGAPCGAGNPPSANKTLVDQAVADAGTAFGNANAGAPDYTELGAGNIGGLNLGPATYKWSTGITIPSNVMLTGGPNDVWIFQIAQGISVSSGVQVMLAGGALPQNVYWAAFAAADLGTTSKFKGNLISQTSIVMKTGSTINGRLMAGTAVTLDATTVGP